MAISAFACASFSFVPLGGLVLALASLVLQILAIWGAKRLCGSQTLFKNFIIGTAVILVGSLLFGLSQNALKNAIFADTKFILSYILPMGFAFVVGIFYLDKFYKELAQITNISFFKVPFCLYVIALGFAIIWFVKEPFVTLAVACNVLSDILFIFAWLKVKVIKADFS